MISRPLAESAALHCLALALVFAAVSTHKFIVVGTGRPVSGVTLSQSYSRAESQPAKQPLRQPKPAPKTENQPITATATVNQTATATATASATASVSGAADSSSPGYDSYLGRVRAQIDRAIVYPTTFRVRRISGSVLIHLNLDAKGEIRASEIATSSGSAELDRFVLDSVKAAGPFPPSSKDLSFNLPIELKMR
jgi:TonB family protein